MCIILHGQLFVGTSYGTTIASAASLASSKKVGKCAQDALNEHSEGLEGFLSDVAIFGDVACACKKPKIIT